MHINAVLESWIFVLTLESIKLVRSPITAYKNIDIEMC